MAVTRVDRDEIVFEIVPGSDVSNYYDSAMIPNFFKSPCRTSFSITNSNEDCKLSLGVWKDGYAPAWGDDDTTGLFESYFELDRRMIHEKFEEINARPNEIIHLTSKVLI